MTMGMRAQGAAGPSIGAFTRGTQNIAKGTAKTTVTRALPALAAVRVLGPLTTFNWSMYALSAYVGYRPFYESIGPEKKLGIRYGGKGTVSVHHVMGMIPPRGMYTLPHFKKVRVPALGWGIAAVPAHESRLPFESGSHPSVGSGSSFEPSSRNQKGVQTPSNGGRVPVGEAELALRGAQRYSEPTQSPSFKRRARVTRKHSRTPWCPTHKTRHWCRITRRR